MPGGDSFGELSADAHAVELAIIFAPASVTVAALGLVSNNLHQEADSQRREYEQREMAFLEGRVQAIRPIAMRPLTHHQVRRARQTRICRNEATSVELEEMLEDIEELWETAGERMRQELWWWWVESRL